ncbi:uncharacterized protein LOC110623328 [Manihot esculenta]|uniref:uncharacterized protein LOC110623328 n=1 Tax=Manihot esculenta TaxID=3983 RepID=UPI000B5D7057|nr:uncharacterized protein LOC110623328 [Manihot esculenta]
MERIKDEQGSWKLRQVARGESEEANFLAKMAATDEQHLTQPFQFEKLHISAKNVEESFPIEEGESWMTPVYKFLTQDDLPADELSAKQIIRKSSKYALIDGWLYKRSSIQPWLHCVTEEEGHKILKNIHKGDCGSYEGAQTIVQKAFKQGYYWSMIVQDVKQLAHKCRRRQVHANIPRTPREMQ